MSITLESLLLKMDDAFWPTWMSAARVASTFEEVIHLAGLSRKATERGMGMRPAETLRVALLGGYSLYPFRELLDVTLRAEGFAPQFFDGGYDNYSAEILNPPPALDAFRPQVVFILPSEMRCRYHGGLADAVDKQRAQAMQVVTNLLALAESAHARHGAEVFLGNFAPTPRFDPGAFRSRTLGSDWNFRRLVNLELGLRAPSYVQICDVDFLATRRGALSARDDRGWLESKQPGSPELLVDLAREVAIGARLLKRPPKKVLVLDLDNTCWGGVLAEEGIEEIALGGPSAHGQAFKSFQRYCLKLKERGVLLAVCSKNDYSVATQPFLNHPEMVLKLEHFVSFKANWKPKGENLREIAAELSLSLDSFVFVDDNPAEVENVRQLAPEVTSIRLGPDPADHLGQLQDARLFEPRSLTAEDAARTEGYFQEALRKEALSSARSLDDYLQSLKMEGRFARFSAPDVSRISQLINKSNQFNVTTRRRSEGEVSDVATSGTYLGFTLRLADRFGDYGIIAVLIGKIVGETCEIDTWVMSCRVLQRGVEEETLNEIARLAKERGCKRLTGLYLPTAKNGLVKDLFARLGFRTVNAQAERAEYELDLTGYEARASKIALRRREAPAAETA